MTEKSNDKSDWHLNKTVTVGFIFTLITYGFLGIFYAIWIFFQVNLLTERTNNNKAIIERLIKVEVQVEAMKDSVIRIEDSVSKILNKTD